MDYLVVCLNEVVYIPSLFLTQFIYDFLKYAKNAFKYLWTEADKEETGYLLKKGGFAKPSFLFVLLYHIYIVKKEIKWEKIIFSFLWSPDPKTVVFRKMYCCLWPVKASKQLNLFWPNWKTHVFCIRHKILFGKSTPNFFKNPQKNLY